MVSSSTEMENGRTRRYYQLTDKGNKHLEKSRLEWNKMARAIDGILGGAA
jgi:DNA-binding PadR family transcriptional regulator